MSTTLLVYSYNCIYNVVTTVELATDFYDASSRYLGSWNG